MRKIALETVIFKKKNRYLRIDFLLILKRALLLLFLENLIYLIFQLCALLISSFGESLNRTSFAFPVVVSVFYSLFVVLIFVFQTTNHSNWLILLKTLEFVSFTIVLSKSGPLVIKVCLSALRIGFTSISVVMTLNIILVLLWVSFVESNGPLSLRSGFSSGPCRSI